MTTEQPVRWIYETFGGNVTFPHDHYHWGIYSSLECLRVCEGMLPYLKLKRDKAEEVIGLCVSRTQN
jgi:hypothetical protein